MNRVHQAASGLFFMLALYIGAKSLTDLQFYTRLGPGPGFFPFCLVIGLGVLAASMFYTATFGDRQPLALDFVPDRAGLARLAAIILAIGAVAFAMEPVGFRLTMFAFVMFLLFAFGNRNIVLMLIVAGAGSFGIFALFVDLLKVTLPIGSLGI